MLAERFDVVWAHGRPAVAPAGDRALEDCAAQVWRIDTRAIAREDDLDDDERRRAAAMLPEVRPRFFAAHAGAREALARTAGIAPRDVVFVRDGGKPRLAHPPLRFNLTHSGDVALVAIAKAAEVGIDVERVRSGRRIEAIAERLFPGPDRAELAAAPPGEREALFFRLWVRNEALVKATGAGLAGLRALHGDAWPPAGWLHCDLPAPAGYAAAIVVEDPAGPA